MDRERFAPVTMAHRQQRTQQASREKKRWGHSEVEENSALTLDLHE
jgi:hypothetical protein